MLDAAITRNLKSVIQYQLIVALNSGKATFMILPPIDIAHNARPMFCSDITGDGWLDVAVVKKLRVMGYEKEVAFCRNDGTGQLGDNGGPNNWLMAHRNAQCVFGRD